MVALNYCKMEQYIMSLSNLKRQQLFLKYSTLPLSAMKCILFLTCHRVWNVAWISHQNSIQTLYCLHTFCSACAFEIGINLAMLHSKSIYSKSNLLTKPSLLSYLKQCHYLSISPWPFMIHLLFMNSNNTFLFQLSELHFCKPIFFEQARV